MNYIPAYPSDLFTELHYKFQTSEAMRLTNPAMHKCEEILLNLCDAQSIDDAQTLVSSLFETYTNLATLLLSEEYRKANTPVGREYYQTSMHVNEIWEKIYENKNVLFWKKFSLLRTVKTPKSKFAVRKRVHFLVAFCDMHEELYLGEPPLAVRCHYCKLLAQTQHFPAMRSATSRTFWNIPACTRCAEIVNSLGELNSIEQYERAVRKANKFNSRVAY